MRCSSRLNTTLAVLVLLGACADARDGSEEIDEVEPTVTEDVADRSSTQPDVADLGNADPVERWFAAASDAFATGEASATAALLHESMHPALRTEFRWCDTAWFREFDWNEPGQLAAIDGPLHRPWEGTVGPLEGETFDDAQELEVIFDTVEGEARATIPFVVDTDRVYWLADCPPKPETRPEAPSQPRDSAREVSTSDERTSSLAPAGDEPSATKHELAGAVTVFATLRDERYADGNCWTTGGYSDIGPGTQVRIEDGNGDLLALSRLGSPYEKPPLDDDSGVVTCHWDFGPVEVPRADFYTVTVSHRSGPTMTYDELVADNWQLLLYFGS